MRVSHIVAELQQVLAAPRRLALLIDVLLASTTPEVSSTVSNVLLLVTLNVQGCSSNLCPFVPQLLQIISTTSSEVTANRCMLVLHEVVENGDKGSATIMQHAEQLLEVVHHNSYTHCAALAADTFCSALHAAGVCAGLSAAAVPRIISQLVRAARDDAPGLHKTSAALATLAHRRPDARRLLRQRGTTHIINSQCRELLQFGTSPEASEEAVEYIMDSVVHFTTAAVNSRVVPSYIEELADAAEQPGLAVAAFRCLMTIGLRPEGRLALAAFMPRLQDAAREAAEELGPSRRCHWHKLVRTIK
eukprot:gene1842-2174_t